MCAHIKRKDQDIARDAELSSQNPRTAFGCFFYTFNIKIYNKPFSYSTKEPGSSVIFILFYTQGSTEWC